MCVWKLDRLGRNLRHLVALVDALQERGVGLRVLSGQGSALDTTRADGRLIFAVFAALAEFERGVISERTRAGLEAARARGRKGGRPRKMTASGSGWRWPRLADPAARPRESPASSASPPPRSTSTSTATARPAAAEAVLRGAARP